MTILIRYIFIAVMLFAGSHLMAQQIVTAEYFWDTDPGQGSGTTLTATDGTFDEAIESILGSNLGLPGTTGVHTFNIRVKDANNNWGPVFSVLIDVNALSSTVRNTQVTEAEYFWDTDPGQGNGTTMLAFDGNFDEAVEAIETNGATLPGVGVHTFSIRVKDVAGNWGPVFTTVLDVNAASLATLRTIKITEGEYFWDTDPGQGNGTTLLAFDGAFDEAIEALTQTITPPTAIGVHLLGVRVKDGAGNWGPVFKVVLDVNESVFTIRDIEVTQAEAFWGTTDPGAGNGTTVLAFDGNFDEAIESLTQTLTLPGTTGAQKLNIRVKDVAGNWGPVFSVVIDVLNPTSSVRDIKVVAAEYFFNTDPGVGNATPMVAADGSFNEVIESLEGGGIPAPVSAGVNILGIRVKDVAGNWGPVFKVVVNIDTTILGYVANISGPDELCANNDRSAVTYTAASATGATFSWSAIGGTITSGTTGSSVTVNWSGAAPYELYLEVCDPNTSTCDQDTLAFSVLPLSSGSRSQTICQGQSVIIGGIPRTTTGVYVDTLSAANGCDSLVTVSLQVNPTATTTVYDTICFGTSYQGYSTSGTYTDVYTATNNCDSTRTLHLTVLPQNATTVNISICQGQSYAGYTATGTYNDTYASVNGCDSTRTLNLTVSTVITTTINQTVCFGGSYLGYNATGTYNDSYTTGGGCDSVRTLNLTVLPQNNVTITDTICQGDSYAGYTTSGTYVDTYQDYRSCDSTRTLVLTVVPVPTTLITETICYGNSYLGYSATGSYADTFVSANGCDSIRTLNLTVLPENVTTIIRSICQGQSYAGYTSSGTYTDVFTDVNNCDSTRTLILTVTNGFTITIDTAVCFGGSYGSYTTSGTYTDTFSAVGNCDSIRILNLTVRAQNLVSITESICAGGNYEGYTTSGNYTDTFTGADGCDSIRELTLTVLPAVVTNVNAAICPGDSIMLGGMYQYTAGTYYDTLSGSSTCDSVVATALTVYPQTTAPNIIKNGTVLSVSSGFAGYQWYQDGNLIAGATSADLAIIANGEYHVVVTDANGCKVSSSTLNVTNVGINDVNSGFNWQAYPNPTDGSLFIQVAGLEEFSLELYNSLGQKLLDIDRHTPQPYMVDMSVYAAGVYYVKLKTGTSVDMKKVLLSR